MTFDYKHIAITLILGIIIGFLICQKSCNTPVKPQQTIHDTKVIYRDSLVSIHDTVFTTNHSVSTQTVTKHDTVYLADLPMQLPSHWITDSTHQTTRTYKGLFSSIEVTTLSPCAISEQSVCENYVPVPITPTTRAPVLYGGLTYHITPLQNSVDLSLAVRLNKILVTGTRSLNVDAYSFGVLYGLK